MHTRLAAATLAAAFLAIYLPDLGHGFIQDDFGWIRGSASHNLSDVVALFGRNVGFYRPLVSLSFAVDFAVWQLNPFGYGLTNLLLCIANAALLFALGAPVPAGRGGGRSRGGGVGVQFPRHQHGAALEGRGGDAAGDRDRVSGARGRRHHMGVAASTCRQPDMAALVGVRASVSDTDRRGTSSVAICGVVVRRISRADGLSAGAVEPVCRAAVARKRPDRALCFRARAVRSIRAVIGARRDARVERVAERLTVLTGPMRAHSGGAAA